MSPTIEDLRATLDDVADSYTAPDPHTVLAGAHTRSGELGRRRTTGRWAAAAAAVVAIGGAGLLLSDPDGDNQGEVAPAEPDESYTEGYGIVDGVPQPYADGLTLVETLDEIGPNGGAALLGFQTDADTQMYAQAWCDTGTGTVVMDVGGTRLTAPCMDRALDTTHLSAPVALPRDAEGFSVDNENSSAGTALVAVYEETEWAEYPFPSWDRVPFPNTEGLVIDNSTPMTTDPALGSVMAPRRVHSVTVPLSDEPLSIDMQLNGPGQLLVAIDGVVLTNDGEELDRLEQTVPGRWDIADPSLREGYLHSFGQERRKTGGGLTPEVLEEEGIDLSDGEVTVSVDARGFPNDDWRVVISSDGGGEGLGTTEPLPSVTELDLAEYAFGHRLVAAYDVPTDGVAHPLDMDPEVATDLTWLAPCQDGLESDPALLDDIGSVTVGGAAGTLSCSGLGLLTPDDFAPAGAASQAVTLALRTTEGAPSRNVAAYEPVTFDDFPFDESKPFWPFSEVPAPKDGETALDEFVYRQTDRITLADLDADGAITIEVPQTRWTELYVTTEGVGRFWLESADPDEGAITSGVSPTNSFGGTLGRDDWWTSWTNQHTTWPILAQTDSGRDPEQVVLRVEGYEQGSLELRVLGQFPKDDQP